MPAELAGWIPQTGATGVLLLAVIWVLRGKIIPRAMHDEVRADRDAYRAAAETALIAYWSGRGSNLDLLGCREVLESLKLSGRELRGLKVGLPNQPEGCTTGNKIARLRDLLDDLAADAG